MSSPRFAVLLVLMLLSLSFIVNAQNNPNSGQSSSGNSSTSPANQNDNNGQSNKDNNSGANNSAAKVAAQSSNKDNSGANNSAPKSVAQSSNKDNSDASNSAPKSVAQSSNKDQSVKGTSNNNSNNDQNQVHTCASTERLKTSCVDDAKEVCGYRPSAAGDAKNAKYVDYKNGCLACRNQFVQSYTLGAC